jgi:oxygen-independent coproporphyrinogen-3 oxidase
MPSSVENILNFLRKNYSIQENAEITLEANPGTFDMDKMQNFHSAGINRISIGIQSFSDDNLRFLGRIYDARQAYAAAEIAAKIFQNFSFDLMYGYNVYNNDVYNNVYNNVYNIESEASRINNNSDGHSCCMASLEHDLRTSVDFGCKHISCYQLTFEENTPFYDRLLRGDITPISEDLEADLYEFTNSFLKDHGIYMYEVSNYAVPGYESRHNLSYWQYDDYLGIGPGAHSRITIDGRKNEIVRISDPFAWANACAVADDSNNRDGTHKQIAYKSTMTLFDEFREIIIMGLRLRNGVPLKKICGEDKKNIFDHLRFGDKMLILRKQKLIENSKKNLKLTELGFPKMNAVIDFLLG